MELRHMRTFVAVTEQGSVSKAALRLGIAQPALSRQIQDLEAELGVTLFERVAKRLILTAEGERLLEDCRSVLEGVDRVRQRAQALRRAGTGQLRIGATSQMIDGVFSEFLHRFAQSHADLQIKFVEAAGPKLLELLERGDAQLVISGTRAIEGTQHPFAIFPLPPVEFLAAYGSQWQLGNASDIDVRELGPRPLLLLDTSFFFRKTFDLTCRAAGYSPNVFFESHTPHALLSLAEAGHGIAVVASILPTHRYRLRKARLLYEGRPLREPFAVLSHRKRPPPVAEAFCHELAAYMSQSAASLNTAAGAHGRPRAKSRATSRARRQQG
jgi:DNA-binding transcriptional LysR family regulator